LPPNRARFAFFAAAVFVLAAGCGLSPERARAKIEALELTFDENGLGNAVLSPDTELVELFLAAGYDVSTFDDPKKAPLMLAARGVHLATMELLIEAGARADELPGVLVVPVMRRELKKVSMLLDAGAEVDARDQSGQTALLAAIAVGNIEGVRLLLDRGANPDGVPGLRPRRRGNNPLIAALEAERSEIVDALIAAGANVNATDKRKTPLIAAAHSGSEEMVDRLLAAGADPALENAGVTAAQTAMRAGNDELAARLEQASAP